MIDRLPPSYRLLADGKSFADYIAATVADLTAALPGQPQAVAARKPFDRTPDGWGAAGPRRAALMFHGLLTTPFDQRDIAATLFERGYRVCAPLMPHHGGALDDQLNADLDVWIAASGAALDHLAGEADEIVLVGYSTGAALALWHAFQGKQRVAAMILVAPAIGLEVAPGIRLGICRQTLGRLNPAWNWLVREAEDDYARHNSCSVAAGAAVLELTRRLRPLWTEQRLGCPALLVLSQEDAVVSADTAYDFLQEQTDPRHRALVYAAADVRIEDARVEVVPSRLPDRNIRDFAHTALPFRLDNPHYGPGGDYTPKIFDPILPIADASAVELGEIGLSERLTRRMRRLMFNPRFDRLEAAIDAFLNEL